MDDSSFLPSMAPLIKSNVTGNDTGSSNHTIQSPEYGTYLTIFFVLHVFNLLLGLFGMATNGRVIWIVGHMTRNSFTTYIMNLSIADFGLLTTVVCNTICMFLILIHMMGHLNVLFRLLSTLSIFTFNASQFLLAAISMDRCVCLFFPLWHKYHRPTHLSTIVCVTIWSLTFSFSAVDFALAMSVGFHDLWYYQFLLNVVLCMPAIAISAIAMAIKVCFFSRHHKWKKLLRAIFLALFFFLFFGFPLNISALALHKIASQYIMDYATFSAVLNSAVNPVIYFLVGRDRKAQSRKSLKKILAKLFQEEEESSKEEVESSAEKHM